MLRLHSPISVLYVSRACVILSETVVIIATLKAGAAFVVADQSHPLERTKSSLDIAQPTILVHDDGNQHIASELCSVMLEGSRR